MSCRFRCAGLYWVVALFVVGPVPARGQVSPGPLARAHQSLEGPTRCATCHAGGSGVMNQRCLDCHKEIQWLITADRGYHANDPAAKCSTCHPDHAGVDFQMIKWPEGGLEHFDHRRSGWALEGAHADVKCRDCHKAALRKGEAARLSPRRGPEPGWVGLERGCASCHEDVHRNALDRRCEVCHDVKDWSFATRFDHARSRYPLTGLHAEVNCDACHQPPRDGAVLNQKGQPIPLFKPLRFGQCSECHQDPHTGRLGTKCDDCHTTRGFKVIGREQFNHDRTRFPLRGQHAGAACADCHDPRSPRQWTPAFATCGACHADAHGGQATLAGSAVDCDACHTLSGFRPASFTVAQHAATKYPLEGGHARVACASCHLRVPPGPAADSLGTSHVRMRPGFTTCRSCHADDHGSQLADRRGGGACEGCHVFAGWRPTTFTVARHDSLRVPLKGRHAAAACRACHGPGRPNLAPIPATQALGRAGVWLRPTEVECGSCHVDPHAGRFARGGERPKDGGCLACHGYEAWRPSSVDVAAHKSFAYPLAGAHRAVPCEACHEDSKTPGMTTTLLRARRAIPSLRFSTRGTQCAACHDSPHGAQFASRQDLGRCEACHGEGTFAPADRFDHDRDASFPLRGAHAQVACAKCHKTETGPWGRPMVRFRPLASTCESCHLVKANRS